jgi:tetratricopeptide (TPR) repeat protein
MQQYRDQPVGTVTVHNILDEEVRDLKASLFIDGYMDFPTESTPLRRLKAREKAELDLKVLFNTSVFDLQEDLPVQARIEVSYQSSRGVEKTSKVETLMLYRKTALVWDDSAKLAAFVMPNEEIVSTFAHRVSDIGEAEKRYRLSSRLFRGMRICDALGSYRITYIEDPDSPISKVLGKTAVVDTVRFPRTTLLIRSGDCDDTSALLGSLLESVGIGTAIMTSPGHVFLAFNTGEPEENQWLFTHRNLQVLIHGGTVWLPVETTVLEEGFMPAWEYASELVQKYRKKVEFLPVREQRDRYPPLPLPVTDLGVFEPPEREVDTIFSNSLRAVEDTLYGESLKLLKDRLEAQRGKAAVRVRNQIGVLHARFGKDREAEAALSHCLAEAPDFTAAYLNLANLKLLRGELEEAAEIARTGLQRNPNSALLNVFLALYHNRKGEPHRASTYLDKVRSSSPELAQRYSYLADTSSAQARAGSKEDLSLIWDSGD